MTDKRALMMALFCTHELPPVQVLNISDDRTVAGTRLQKSKGGEVFIVESDA